MSKASFRPAVAMMLLLLQLDVTSFSQTLQRGPYLQMGSQTAITIRWRTNSLSDSKVEVGTVYGTYPIVVSNTTPVTEHIIKVTGLSPDKKYYYRIGTTTKSIQGSPDNFFTTVPPPTTTRKLRISMFGDCGGGNTTYQNENLDNYLNYLQSIKQDAPDAWILLGDNAYTTGTDFQYTTNFFDIYGSTILKNHKLYPTLGNHDYANDDAVRTSRSIAYYNTFSTPQNGECGGVPSNKPNFYSFDLGNIHFLSLDSWGIESDNTEMGTAGNSMLKTWLNQDLAANKSKWTIAFFHHPPYTKGTHNSDVETDLMNIRTNFIDELEKAGVDLVVTGHSHNYERGYLLRDFRSSWGSFNPAIHAASISSAGYTSSSSCPYVYNSGANKHGTVYVVAGSTGASGTTKSGFGSKAMPFALNDGGIFYVEVEDNRLDAKFLRRDGTIFDQFTIIKDGNLKKKYSIAAGNPFTLTASWPSGKYVWSDRSTNRALTITPPAGTSTYAVTDEFGCITDSFFLTALAPLPVSLTRFQVYTEGSHVNVEWTTASETNSWYYGVERSVDGRNFDPLVRKEAAGNSSVVRNYAFRDNSPLKGITYYRLAQADLDGKVTYSDLRKVTISRGSDYDIRLSISGNSVKFLVQSMEGGPLQTEAYDLQGKLVKKETATIQPGSSELRMQLSKGAYILKMTLGNREPVVQKIIVE